ncbi:MAG: response regulator [Bacteroidales bacterium]|nr:response regulator [Bacteroidales bacterium]
MSQGEESTSKKTILIAEDEPINFMLLQKMLERTGFEILWGKNGQEAVDMAVANNSVCLILMDIRMPLIDGIEATKIIHNKKPNIHIVAVTAYTLSNEKEKCKEAGAVGFLSKPVRPTELIPLVEKLMNTHKKE